MCGRCVKRCYRGASCLCCAFVDSVVCVHRVTTVLYSFIVVGALLVVAFVYWIVITPGVAGNGVITQDQVMGMATRVWLRVGEAATPATQTPGAAP